MNYEEVTFTVTYENFVQLADKTPELKSVLRGTKSEMAFTAVDVNPSLFQFIYVQYKDEFKAHMLKLLWKAENFYGLILQFVFDMCRTYDLIDPVQMYNTYLTHVRDTLEHFGVNTINVFELEDLKQRTGG